MAKLEFSEGDYQVSASVIKKEGLLIDCHKDNEWDFYISPVVEKGTGKIDKNKKDILVLSVIKDGDDFPPKKDFQDALKIARKVADKLNKDLIVSSKIESEYGVTNHVVTSGDRRVPVSYDEMKMFDNVDVKIAPRSDSEYLYYKNSPASSKRLPLMEIFVPETINAQIDLSDYVPSDNIRMIDIITVKGFNEDGRIISSSDFSKITLEDRNTKNPTSLHFAYNNHDEIKIPKLGDNSAKLDITLDENLSEDINDDNTAPRFNKNVADEIIKSKGKGYPKISSCFLLQSINYLSKSLESYKDDKRNVYHSYEIDSAYKENIDNLEYMKEVLQKHPESLSNPLSSVKFSSKEIEKYIDDIDYLISRRETLNEIFDNSPYKKKMDKLSHDDNLRLS